MIQLEKQHIVVIGAARSGLAAARLLSGRGMDVFVSDSSAIHSEIKAELDRSSISWEENGHSDRARQADLVVVSPGVPDRAPLMTFYRDQGIPVYSELEAASWFNHSPVIAVTGSNGKTTVTRWMEHLWGRAGKACLTAGNIGRAFSDVTGKTGPETTAILEVSSFQLDHIATFRPAISVILNITPDHLDRYNNQFDNYVQSKLRITENQQNEDLLIYNADDKILAREIKKMKERSTHPRLFSYSIEQETDQGMFVRGEEIIFTNKNSEEVLMRQEEIQIPGKHNLYNGLATALAARISEIHKDSIRESLETFEGVEHRLELVTVHNGVRYVNDSKATNINAVWFALDSFRMPVVLILGGRDKGNDYRELSGQIREKVHTIIAIGEAREEIRRQLGRVVPKLLEAETLPEAVRKAADQAKRGEIVLLSPACASFDMFESYEQRGNIFKQAVKELT